ncbi:MAG: hypothetical protein BroJett040_13230 [Oligoflexia bacterium]|nr:MAG: hypothetical protein BroJett040_13230 [Oligoflexia bacterium]
MCFTDLGLVEEIKALCPKTFSKKQSKIKDMRFAYIIEDDPRFVKEIAEVIRGNIDKEMQIRVFASLEQFANWIKMAMLDGAAAVPHGGQAPPGFASPNIESNEGHEIALFISKIEFIGKSHIGLLQKTKKLFLDKNICKPDRPTGFVLTAFEQAEGRYRDFETEIINNIICKPFDKLILQQHLQNAIDGRKPLSQFFITNQKVDADIEMLKEVRIEGYSDIGFISKGNREIAPGSHGKYYGNFFATDRKKYCYGKVLSCQPDPQKQGEYFITITFMGLAPDQLSKVRQGRLKKDAAKLPFDWTKLRSNPSLMTRPGQFVIIEDDEPNALIVEEALKKRFKQNTVVRYPTLMEFLIDLDPKLADAPPEKSAGKPFSCGPDMEFIFDPLGNLVTGFNTEIKDPFTAFGVKDSDWKIRQNWFGTALGVAQKEKWKEWLRQPSIGTEFMIKNGEVPYYFKPVSVVKESNRIIVKMAELSPTEILDYLLKNSRLPHAVDALFVSQRYFQGEEYEAKWIDIIDRLNKRGQEKVQGHMARAFILTNKDFPDLEMRKLGAIVADIFVKPVDRAYLMQKMRSYFPELAIVGDPVQFETVSAPQIIKASNPVKMTEISEASTIIRYPRLIPVGEFREFMLFEGQRTDIPELLAQCNFVQEAEDKDYECQFIFYAVTDHFAKSVRIWIRDNYIDSKKKSS